MFIRLFLVSFLFVCLFYIVAKLRTTFTEDLNFSNLTLTNWTNQGQVGQMKHCNHFPWGPTLPAVCFFFYLASMRLSLEIKKKFSK